MAGAYVLPVSAFRRWRGASAMTLKRPMTSSGGTASTMTGCMVVARFVDGRMIKGTTQDFLPNKPMFHIYADDGTPAVSVSIVDLKAVFFVRSLEGDTKRVDEYDFEKTGGYGRKCVVTLTDGEVIAGYTSGYSANRPGFFLIPAEADSNNARVFIVNKAVKDLAWV